MDLDTAVLFALVVLIGSNHVLMRLPWARENAGFFWGVNILDLVSGAAVLVFGLPGMPTSLGIHWLVGLLLIAHVAQNLQLRASWRQREREEARLERDAIRRQMRQEREEREATEGGEATA